MPLTLLSASPDVTALAKPRLMFSFRKELADDYESIDFSQPQPLYTVNTDDILEGTITPSGPAACWQLLVLRSKAPFATLEMRVDRKANGDETYRYAGVYVGAYTHSIYDALHRAEQIASAPAPEYELRILRAPTVYLYAVWLHAHDGDLIIPCAPAPAPLEPNQPMEPAAVCRALEKLATRQASGEYKRRQ